MFTRRALFPAVCLVVVLVPLGRWVCCPDRAEAAAENRAKGAGGVAKDLLPHGAIVRLGTAQFPKNYRGSTWVTFLPDGSTVATLGPVRKLAFWEARTGKEIRAFEGHIAGVISPDGKKIASRADWKDKAIRLLDLETGKEIAAIAMPVDFHSDFRFSHDSRYLAVGGGSNNNRNDDPPLQLYDAASGKKVREFPIPWRLETLAFSADGKKIATAHHNTNFPVLQLWDVASGKEIRHFEEKKFRFSPSSITISPDGNFLAGVGNSIRVWDLHTGKERWQVYFGDPKIGNLGDDGAASVGYSPNAKMIAVGTAKGTIYLFEAATGRQRGRFDGHKESVFSVCFSPCGLLLASATSHGDYVPLVWDVTGQIPAAKSPPPAFSAKELDACWTSLAGGEPPKFSVVDMRAQDAAKAWQAICALTIRPEQAVPFLKKRLPATARLEPKRAARVQADLENGDLPARDRACKELAQIGPPAIPFLQKLAATGINADAKQRIENLLGQPRKSGLLAEELRCQCAVEILEYIGTPQARQLLRAQADGEPALQTTRDATSALDRLAKRPVSPRPE